MSFFNLGKDDIYKVYLALTAMDNNGTGFDGTISLDEDLMVTVHSFADIDNGNKIKHYVSVVLHNLEIS